MKPSDIRFSNKNLALQKGAGKKLNALAQSVGKGLLSSVSGAVEAKQTVDGWVLFFPRNTGGNGSAATPFFVRLILDGATWKARIYPGTVNGTSPVMGDIESTGGTAINTLPAPEITLDSSKNLIVLGLKIDLETDTILRLTVENREDSDIAPIEDLTARFRIFFDTIAVLEYTASPASWRVTDQVRNTHLTYEFGTVYCAST